MSLTRRGLVGGGAALAAGGAFAAGRWLGDDDPGERVFAFRGDHQAGITTEVQDHLHLAAFDLTTDDREQVVDLLRRWTYAAERMTRGEPAGPTTTEPDLPPDDTGEALDLPPAGLTITFGFGASFLEKLGLEDRLPAGAAPLPHFPGDQLDPARSDGDLVVQACADDPQVAVHAVRNLARIGFGAVGVRWSQLGFGRTSSTTAGQTTPRNLFGFKDGTANIRSDEGRELDAHVWVQDGDWLAGGSYLVVRRIEMTIEVWDRQPLADQESFVGRHKVSGAPLSGGEEFSDPRLDALPVDSHVRVVHPDNHGGVRMLRRGYNFVDGSDPLGGLSAGLLFLAYVRDPQRQFVPVQDAMSRSDALMEYLRVTGSGLFLVPPGLGPGEYVGQPLLG